MKIIHKLKSIIKPAVIIPSALLFLTLTSALILLSSNSNADTTSATASVTVPDTCYMSSTSYNHTGTINGGTYTENFGGESTVTVTCNDRNGYSVYAVGYSNDIEGTNGLIGTSTGLVIPSGTSTSGSVSNWAMKLTPVAGTFAPTILSDANGSFANYHVVPTTTTKVATLTSDINVSNSSQFKTSYAVSVAPTQAADTYIGKVKYTVVHPNYTNADGTLETYNIPVTFAGTGVSSVTLEATGYPTRTVSTSGSTANLTAGVQYTVTASFTSGYEFVSWALNNASYGTLGSTSTNPTTFTPNANSASAVITATGQKPKTYIQDLTLASCQSQASSGNITVYDKRDEKDYTVRYINGYCWMTQNLRFTGTSLDSTTSNVASTYTASSPYYVNGSSVKAYKSLKNDSVCKGTSLTTGNSTNLCMQDSGSTSTGVWYNYAAASAGTITGTSNSTAAQYDICPKNWHLPSGPNTTANTDINKLVGNTTSGLQNQTTGLTAFSAVAGGLYRNGSLFNTGSGYWWSATASNTTNRYYLLYNSSNGQFYGNDYYSRYYGFFVRCVRSS